MQCHASDVMQWNARSRIVHVYPYILVYPFCSFLVYYREDKPVGEVNRQSHGLSRLGFIIDWGVLAATTGYKLYVIDCNCVKQTCAARSRYTEIERGIYKLSKSVHNMLGTNLYTSQLVAQRSLIILSRISTHLWHGSIVATVPSSWTWAHVEAYP